MGKPLKDEAGKRYGRWLVLERSPNKRSTAAWLCKCDCGTEAVVVGSSLRAGTSAGCSSCAAPPTHSTHGMSGTPEYQAWCGVVSRTGNPNNKAYKNYGGRGIRMSDEWRSSFDVFYRDMGPRPSPKHSVERIDNDGPYSRENCVWAERRVQARNKRTNVVVEHNGVERCLSDWASEMGISPQTLYHRYRVGLTDPELLFSKEKLLWVRKPKGWRNRT